MYPFEIILYCCSENPFFIAEEDDRDIPRKGDWISKTHFHRKQTSYLESAHKTYKPSKKILTKFSTPGENLSIAYERSSTLVLSFCLSST